MSIENILLKPFFILIALSIIFYLHQRKSINRLENEIRSLQLKNQPDSEQVSHFDELKENSESSKELDTPYLKDISNIEINDEFRKTFLLIENSNDCIFITGKAGTGKSTLLKYFAAKSKKQVVYWHLLALLR